MDKNLRQQFNRAFTAEKYNAYMQKIEALHPGALDFRNAETPVFVPKAFKEKMLDACDEIINVLTDPHFIALTQNSIPKEMNVPGEDAHTQFLVFDFGVCKNAAGELEPQLIEMQGFPTLFGFQVYHSRLTAEYANLPSNYSAYLNGYTEESYTRLLKEIIVGDLNPENVILLEIFPRQQKTRIDFYCTETLLGIKTVCLTKVIAEGKNLFYESGGKIIPIKRIYNRVIFDDLDKQENLPPIIDLSKPYDVEWVPHPNWFNRISKYTLPFIKHQYVPETYFLNEIKQAVDLNEFVLKPLFSFAGMGVVIDVQQSDIDAIQDPENWILQRKVNYAPVIETPNEPAKAEIRLFYFWKNEEARPVGVLNLARLSKGKMIGTRYNKDKDWVGGSVAFFEQ